MSIADALFSKTQQSVLRLLFGQPNRKFQVTELIRLAESGSGGTHSVLTRLADAGLISVERFGNAKLYSANSASPIFDELMTITHKTFGLVGPLQDALELLADRIEFAFVFGSIAKGTDHTDSDIDLMVVSDELSLIDLYSHLEVAESQLARRISPTLMTTREWHRKLNRDSFVSRVAAGQILPVIGEIGDVKQPRESS